MKDKIKKFYQVSDEYADVFNNFVADNNLIDDEIKKLKILCSKAIVKNKYFELLKRQKSSPNHHPNNIQCCIYGIQHCK